MARQSASVTRAGFKVTSTAASDRIPLSRSDGASRGGNWFLPLGARGRAGLITGPDHWPRSLAQITGPDHWPRSLAQITGPDHWPRADLRNSATSALALSA